MERPAGERRVDGPLKVTGGARYTGDLQPPDCLHAALVQSTVARGSIRNIETGDAERAPGVRLVLTHKNALPLDPAPVLLGEAGHQASAAESRLPLQDGTVHHAGQHLGLVVALTAAQAEDAAGRVRVTYDVLPARADLDDPAVEAMAPANGWHDPAEASRGDFAAGWAAGWDAATARVDETYVTAMQHHVTMEPHATIAAWDGDRVTVQEPTTWPHGARRTIAAWFGLDEGQVRVVQRFVGGSFGGKGPIWPHVALVVMAAKLVGRPVKLVLSRRQTFDSVGHRPRIRQRMRLAAAADGRLTALAHDALSHSSPFDSRIVAPVTKTTRRLYACPNIVTTYRMKQLSLGGPFTMRGPGETPGLFALECAMDELADRLDMDPIALRLVNHADTDPDTGRSWSSKHLKACYARGAERFGWARRRAEPGTLRDGHARIGLGMASMAYDARAAPTGARAILTQGGELIIQSATCDQGTGSYTVYRLLAAETFGWPVERTRFELGDTAMPFAPISAGSMTTGSVGSAVKAAVSKLRRQLIELACADPGSPLHRLEADSVLLDGGLLQGPGGRSEEVLGLLRQQGCASVEVDAQVEPGRLGEGSACYSFGAHFAQVRVDDELGEVRVTRYVGAFAAGRILNPILARSQLLGGIVWGIGMALHEESELDTRSGRVMNANLADYLVPVNADIGAIEAFFVDEEDDRVNPLGVKGIGEIGTVGAAAAVANAVHNATGRRIRTLPITPAKLLASSRPKVGRHQES